MMIQRVTSVLLLLFVSLQLQAAQPWPFPPVQISNPGQDASSPQIAVDGNGDVVAVWVENTIIHANSADITGTWSGISVLSGSGASSPCVVIDGSGTATAAWITSSGINIASRPLNGSWSTPPGTIAASGATSLKMAIDPSGNIVLAWEESDGCIHSATQLAGGSWPVSSDTLSAAGASSPNVAMGASGLVVAVWQGVENAVATVYQASKLVAGVWGAPAILSQADVNSAYPQIAVDAVGNAHAIWFTYSETSGVFSQVVVQATSCPANGSWSAPVNISDVGVRNPADLVSALAAGVSGQAIALWSFSYDGSLFLYEWNLLSDGSWLPAPGPLGSSNILAYSCCLAVDANGVAYVACMNYDDAAAAAVINNSVNDIKTVSGAGFSAPWMLSRGSGNGYPVGAVATYGLNAVTVAAWEQFDGANNVIQSVVSVIPNLEPPSGLAVTPVVNNYGIVSEIDNVVQWLASPSAGVCSYIIFRDGVQIGVAYPSQLQFIDHNRTIGETVTYTIYSNDIYARQSAPVAIAFTN